MGRLKDINEYVRMIPGKIPQLRLFLVMLDSECKDWQFADLVNALKLWGEKNPSIFKQNLNLGDMKKQAKDCMLQKASQKWKQSRCVYCKATEHKSMAVMCFQRSR